MIYSRIAPTPSGYLHIGNAWNFILTWVWVRRADGTLRLRIDDHDGERTREEYIDDVFHTLEWLGIDWDEGPKTSDEERRIYTQALRSSRYDQMILALIKTGKVFACECSRKELLIRPCICRDKQLKYDMPDTSLRIITPSEPILVHDAKVGTLFVTLDQDMTNFIIRRRDGIHAYQLVSLTDDIDYGINLIVRGKDLLTSTAAQLYLASLIGEDVTVFSSCTFYHHELLCDEQGHKLSKSAGSRSLKAMRESGMTREDFYIKICELMQIGYKVTSIKELLESDFKIF